VRETLDERRYSRTHFRSLSPIWAASSRSSTSPHTRRRSFRRQEHAVGDAIPGSGAPLGEARFELLLPAHSSSSVQPVPRGSLEDLEGGPIGCGLPGLSVDGPLSVLGSLPGPDEVGGLAASRSCVDGSLHGEPAVSPVRALDVLHARFGGSAGSVALPPAPLPRQQELRGGARLLRGPLSALGRKERFSPVLFPGGGGDRGGCRERSCTDRGGGRPPGLRSASAARRAGAGWTGSKGSRSPTCAST